MAFGGHKEESKGDRRQEQALVCSLLPPSGHSGFCRLASHRLSNSTSTTETIQTASKIRVLMD